MIVPYPPHHHVWPKPAAELRTGAGGRLSIEQWYCCTQVRPTAGWTVHSDCRLTCLSHTLAGELLPLLCHFHCHNTLPSYSEHIAGSGTLDGCSVKTCFAAKSEWWCFLFLSLCTGSQVFFLKISFGIYHTAWMVFPFFFSWTCLQYDPREEGVGSQQRLLTNLSFRRRCALLRSWHHSWMLLWIW